MATPEEIRQRVQEIDIARSARRAAAAQQVGELAGHRASIVAQLAVVERELGEVVADAQDVIDVDELAAFTDLKPSDLTGWLEGRKATRGRRKKTTTASMTEGTRAVPRDRGLRPLSGCPTRLGVWPPPVQASRSGL
ncbi:hypothetical protein [Umezawaea tangerina]|uniref:hypothetical protein n=1 Tax=Umezawaea tangerina TaxID=84725 RepID=UPI0011B28D48|nr:hypothetical protein [Umezawaea tangerina]